MLAAVPDVEVVGEVGDGVAAVALVLVLPFAAGVMTHFERDFYAGTIQDETKGWKYW